MDVSLFRALSFAVTMAGVLAVGGCSHQPTGSAAPGAPVVRVQKPQVQSVTDYEFFTGQIEAPDAVDLRASRVTGYLVRWNFEEQSDKPPLKEYNFTPGEEVKRDQVLFKIDPRPYKAEYDQAFAQVDLMKARLKLAKADYARAQEVAKTPGAISRQDVDKYAAAEGEAAAAVAAAEASAESARLNLEFTDVRSAIDGVVSRNLLSVGNMVTANDTLLTTIVSQDPMYVYFDIDEHTLLHVMNLLREGKLPSIESEKAPVDVALDLDGSNYPYTAYVDFADNRIDPTTGTLQVRGVLDNPKPEIGPRIFAPGMFVRVRLPMGPPHQGLVVPQKAIGTDQGDRYLLVVNEKNIVEYRPVTAGQEQPGEMQEVIPMKVVIEQNGQARPVRPGEKGVDSITANDRIIVGGLQRARPGSEVQPKEEPPQETLSASNFGNP